jgi:hypothetical protein
MENAVCWVNRTFFSFSGRVIYMSSGTTTDTHTHTTDKHTHTHTPHGGRYCFSRFLAGGEERRGGQEAFLDQKSLFLSIFEGGGGEGGAREPGGGGFFSVSEPRAGSTQFSADVHVCLHVSTRCLHVHNRQCLCCRQLDRDESDLLYALLHHSFYAPSRDSGGCESSRGTHFKVLYAGGSGGGLRRHLKGILPVCWGRGGCNPNSEDANTYVPLYITEEFQHYIKFN